MPYRTVYRQFTDGASSWMEPERVWVDPTPEEAAAEAEAQARDRETRDGLSARVEQLIADMKEAQV